ncbi:Uncharacterized protein YcnI [Blastococcus aurantiacus]|uniref:Uncharacterized protein YcnI n=1 Tax=Blastococcus aurantiacus TaxID=1550231 RepID=A0A1G7R8Z6_9ACTN|nr:Uncharacterized protein YcnI [Blastococcus aurantiacus]
MLPRATRMLTVSLAAITAALTVGGGVASAHIGVSSADAAPGGFGEVTFRVPNESDTASTTTLRVQISRDTPLASLRTKPIPGWTATLTRSSIDPPVDVHGTEVSEAVTEITWTAEPGAGIGPGQYQTFSFSGGPFPDVEELTLPIIQIYDDGSESAWIEPTIDGQEPEDPAPVLALVAETGSDDTSDNATEAAAGGDTAAGTADSGTSGLTVTAFVLSIAGLVAGLAGLMLGLSARRRNATA